ncbi:MAG: DUF4340 domain-containing protein [bacterium]|nr:DUF4340 domain-containing protein [bacterium]
MRLSRTNLVLAIILLALVALDGITWPRAQAVREVLPLFEPWAPGQVTTIRVDQGEQGIFASDSDLLVQLDDAGTYRLPNHFGYPARERAVAFLVNGLASLNSMDLLSEDPASHATYGLTQEKGVRIRLEDKTGKVLADLLQGDKAPGGRAFYVRRFDSDNVFRAPNFIRQSIRGNLLTWIDSRWCGLDADLVQAIEVSAPAGGAPLVLIREKGSRQIWKNAAGEQVSSSNVQVFLRALGLVTIKDVAGEGNVEAAGGGGRLTYDLPRRAVQFGRVAWEPPGKGRTGKGPFCFPTREATLPARPAGSSSCSLRQLPAPCRAASTN